MINRTHKRKHRRHGRRVTHCTGGGVALRTDKNATGGAVAAVAVRRQGDRVAGDQMEKKI